MKAVMDDHLAVVHAVREMLVPVTADPMTEVRGDALLELTHEVECVGRQVDAMRASLASQVNHLSRRGADDNLAEEHGFTRGKHLLESVTGASGAEVGRRIRLGDAIRPRIALTGEVLPPVHEPIADAVHSGRIDPEAAAVIITCMDNGARTATVEDVWQAETNLVELATETPVDSVKDQARVYQEWLDPDGAEPREDAIRNRRSFRLGRERNGVTPVSGHLAPECAALLKSTFDEVNNPGATPRFVEGNPWNTKDPTAEITDDSGEVSVKVLDHRSRDQKQHDALYGVLLAGVRNSGTGPAQMSVHAEVTAVVREADLISGRGVGWIDGIGEPASVTTVRMWLCDAGYRRAILGATGEVLALGRTQYPFSPGQRKAIALRDGSCVCCGAPAAWCDVHHVRPYNADGGVGETDTNNGVLLCRRCHTWIHRSRYRIRMTGGVPYLLAPPAVDPAQKWKRLRTSRINLTLPRPEPPPF